MSIESIISAFDEGFERTKRDSLPLTKEEWQTLKSAVLGTTHNKQSTPLDKPTQFYCQNCGGKFTGVHFCNNRG